jgi:hypothetical protein
MGQYDSEIAHFTRRLAEEGRIHASAAAADVNELAKAGSVGPVRTPPERPRTRVQAKPSPLRQFATNYDRYRDRIVNLLGVQYSSSQARHADENCKYRPRSVLMTPCP